MKKIVIIEHEGGELANQLWNDLSVYAYCIERGFKLENWSFFEYPGYFALRQSNILVRWLFMPRFKGYTKRKAARYTRAWRKLYKFLLVKPVRSLSRRIIFSTESGGEVYYLPPTKEASKKLETLEQSKRTIFFANVSGAVFRNPEGIQKHREAIAKRYEPTGGVETRVQEILQPLRERFSTIVGVHVRQGDYKGFKGGKYWIPQERVREILDEYLSEFKKSAEQTCFVITSDSPIREEIFQGLNIVVSKETAGVDLFTLAASDALIGSDSTFGHFAAYWANIPHIIMKKEPMDWPYYLGQTRYAPNKYLSIMPY